MDNVFEEISVRKVSEQTGEVMPLDVSDPDSIAASYDTVRQVTNTLDILINNAGISGGNEPLGTVTQETLIANYKVNAAGPILMAQQYLDLL